MAYAFLPKMALKISTLKMEKNQYEPVNVKQEIAGQSGTEGLNTSFAKRF